MPIASVSLVEEHTAQFPGSVGLPEAGRINTLADLVRREDAAALAYRSSQHAEMLRIAAPLQEEMSAALIRLA